MTALYKVATGEDIAKAPAPGMFDLKVPFSPPLPQADSGLPRQNGDETDTRGHKQGKAKKAAWQRIADEGLSPDEAQAKYVTLVEGMKETYGYDENKAPEAVGA